METLHKIAIQLDRNYGKLSIAKSDLMKLEQTDKQLKMSKYDAEFFKDSIRAARDLIAQYEKEIARLKVQLATETATVARGCIAVGSISEKKKSRQVCIKVGGKSYTRHLKRDAKGAWIGYGITPGYEQVMVIYDIETNVIPLHQKRPHLKAA